MVAISSTAGLAGLVFWTAYSAAKFGFEGWIESLAPEVAPFGIRTMIVEPGSFRTDTEGLLAAESTRFAKPSIEDYAERTEQIVTAWEGLNGKQGATRPSSRPRWLGWPAKTSRRSAGLR